MPESYLFASYAREDSGHVLPLLEALRDERVNVWVDVEKLTPGQRWEVALEQALENAAGLLVFVSSRSMKSTWVGEELRKAARALEDQLIIPVILEHVPDLPYEIESRQWIDLSVERDERAIAKAAREIARAVSSFEERAERRSPVVGTAAREVAEEIASEKRHPVAEEPTVPEEPRSVFVVHGHDEELLEQVDGFLGEQGIEAVVLARIGGAAQSLFRKFLEFSSNVRFAIVLLSADDLGVSRVQYEAEGVGDRALQFRARQNVILELGFFYGYLGWENVFVVYQKPDEVFPNFERPSDLDGVLFDIVDDQGTWRESLAERLSEAGFAVAA